MAETAVKCLRSSTSAILILFSMPMDKQDRIKYGGFASEGTASVCTHGLVICYTPKEL